MEVALSITPAAAIIKDPQSKTKARRLRAAADKRVGSSNKAMAEPAEAVDVELPYIITTIISTATRTFRMMIMMTKGTMIGQRLVIGTYQLRRAEDDLVVMAVVADRKGDSKVGTGVVKKPEEGPNNSREEASRERMRIMATIDLVEVEEVLILTGHSVARDQDTTGRLVGRGQQGIGRLEVVGL